MRPQTALILAALAGLFLAFQTSADGPEGPARVGRAEPPGHRYLDPSSTDAGLAEDEVVRALRAAGWPEDRVGEALRVAGCESGWRPAALGSAGEVGLFQIHPVHAARFDFHGVPLDPADPVHNAYVALQIWGKEGWRPWSCSEAAVSVRP